MLIMPMPLFTKCNFIKLFRLFSVVFDAGELWISDSIKSDVISCHCWLGNEYVEHTYVCININTYIHRYIIHTYIHRYIHTYMITIYIYIYVYMVSGHKWSMTNRVLKSHRSKMSVIYLQSWKQCAIPVITTTALWQLIHLGTWCTVTHCWYQWTKECSSRFSTPHFEEY